MKHHFIPRDATVAELERKAADAEEKAANEPEPRAAELREKAGYIPAVGAMDIVSDLAGVIASSALKPGSTSAMAISQQLCSTAIIQTRRSPRWASERWFRPSTCRSRPPRHFAQRV